MAREDGYTIVRYPDSNGAVVAKIAGTNVIIPDEVHDYSGFVFSQVSDASTLTNKTVDRTDLSTSEWDLINQIDYRPR